MNNYIKEMRMHHYVKNLLVLLPVFFSGKFFTWESIVHALFAFLAFCFVSSAVYVLNDIRDVEKDRLHSKKKSRPIASGDISMKRAWFLFGVIVVLCAACNMAVFSPWGTAIIVLYFSLNVLYSAGIKNIPIADICILVSGFVLRVMYGAIVTDCTVSNWLYLMITVISFYLALGKRRGELRLGGKTRNVLCFYTHEFLDKNMYMFLAMANIFYALWSADSAGVKAAHPRLLVWTVPAVILLSLRYSFDIESESDADPMDVIMRDKVLIGFGICYAITMCAIFYL